MTSFYSGPFCRAVLPLKRTAQGNAGLHVEQLEPRHHCAVEVTQDGTYIVVHGTPDAGSLDIQHQPNPDDQYDDKVLVSWSSGGVRQTRAFDLYKQVQRGNQRWAVKNVEYLEVSSGSGRNQFWSQTRLSSYLTERGETRAAREVIFGNENAGWQVLTSQPAVTSPTPVA